MYIFYASIHIIIIVVMRVCLCERYLQIFLFLDSFDDDVRLFYMFHIILYVF